jgi:THO complex subunit 2
VVNCCSFTQQKFNLLKEESEGYAKLITTLSQTQEIQNPACIKTIVQNVQSLIGMPPILFF